MVAKQNWTKLTTIITPENESPHFFLVAINIKLSVMFLFSMVFTYIKCRRIKIGWSYIICENIAMVLLLAFYEFIFFNTIIYPYQPLSSDEIERNAIQKLQNVCGLLK